MNEPTPPAPSSAPLKALRSIAEEWDDYCAAVYKGDLPPDQEQEVKRAFYAGASAMYLLLTLGIGAEEVSEATAEAYLMQVAQEFTAFGALVKAGGA
jgi:hypothetical protein